MEYNVVSTYPGEKFASGLKFTPNKSIEHARSGENTSFTSFISDLQIYQAGIAIFSMGDCSI